MLNNCGVGESIEVAISEILGVDLNISASWASLKLFLLFIALMFLNYIVRFA